MKERYTRTVVLVCAQPYLITPLTYPPPPLPHLPPPTSPPTHNAHNARNAHNTHHFRPSLPPLSLSVSAWQQTGPACPSTPTGTNCWQLWRHTRWGGRVEYGDEIRSLDPCVLFFGAEQCGRAVWEWHLILRTSGLGFSVLCGRQTLTNPTCSFAPALVADAAAVYQPKNKTL